MPRKSNNRNRSRNPKRNRKGTAGGMRTLGDGPAYAGQQKVILRLPGTPSLKTTTVTTGVIASQDIVVTSNITGFATRFGSTFDEYRILGVDFLIRPVAASTGVTVFWVDEKSFSAPTANEAQERSGLRLPNTNASSGAIRVVRWRARDLLDLQYIAIGSTTNVATLKEYTDLATWGAPIAATPLWIVEPTFIVEFRGVKSS